MKITLRLTFLITCFIPSLTFAAPTQFMIFNAYTDENVLNSNLVVAQRYKGTCSTHSIANSARNDAWRCQASNMILDPCYQDDNTLACVISPWSDKAAIIETDKPIIKIKRKVNYATQPWGLELSNGDHCTYLAGASILIDKKRVNYSCDRYKYVIGEIDKSSSVWKVHLFNYSIQKYESFDITTVWF